MTDDLQRIVTGKKFKTLRSHLPDIGWGFVVGWGLISAFTPVLSDSSSANLGLFWITSMIGAPAALLALYFLPIDFTQERAKGRARLFAVGSMTLGLLLIEISVSGAAGAEVFRAMGSLISSFGTAVFVVLWGCHYAALPMNRIERMATAALIAAFCCYGLTLLLPRTVSVVIMGCLPFFSAACLAKGRPETRLSQNGSTAGLKTLGTTNVLEFMRLGLGIVGATTIVSLFWSLANDGKIIVPPDSFSVSVLSGSFVAILVMVYLSRYSRSLNLGTLYRWVLPLISIALVLLLFENVTLSVISTLLIFAVQALLNLITFVYFAELSQRSNVSPTKVFSLGRFFVEIGFLFGILLQPVADDLRILTGSYQSALVVFLAGLVVFVMFSIVNQDRLAFSFSAATTRDSLAEAGTDRFTADEVLDRTASEGTLSASSQKPVTADAFRASCDEIGRRFSLTKREREILPFLAQGYSLPYIRNELYISQSTIDTHVRHIYRKMDIHSKEELITLVRDVPRSDGRL